MPLLLRAGLIAVAVLGAFAGGYLLKSPGRLMTVAPDSPSVAANSSATTSNGTVAHTAAPASRTIDTDLPSIAIPPVAVPPEMRPPPLPTTSTSDDLVDPSDPAFQMVKNTLGIKTTLDPAGPTPAVLADAKAAATGPTIQKDDPAPMVGAAPRLEAPPARQPMKLINNRSVALDFEVTKSGLSKVKTVELWVTRNGGETWHKMDEMAGCQSPFSARLGSDGAYGFKMVFESESGMRSPEPRPGQIPELDIELDTTPPHLDIFPPRPVPDQPGKVVLSWSMTDRNPDRGSAATRLEYSTDGETWRPIELPNGRLNWGSIDWTLPLGVPPKVLFRLTVRDKAGNVATAVTDHKVSIDLVAPEGKITGVRRQQAEPDRGPMPRVVRNNRASVRFDPVAIVARALVPVLLNSPVFRVDARWHLFDSVPDRGPNPIEAGKTWWDQVTDTDVLRSPETFMAPLVRHDPFTMPDLGPELQPNPEPLPLNPWPHGLPDDELWKYFRPLIRPWSVAAERQAKICRRKIARERSLICLLTESDWTPSTAEPETDDWIYPKFAENALGEPFDAIRSP